MARPTLLGAKVTKARNGSGFWAHTIIGRVRFQWEPPAKGCRGQWAVSWYAGDYLIDLPVYCSRETAHPFPDTVVLATQDVLRALAFQLVDVKMKDLGL